MEPANADYFLVLRVSFFFVFVVSLVPFVGRAFIFLPVVIENDIL